MTVYIDIIFLENLCMNYIILFAVGMISKHKIKHIRLILSSVLGSAYAIMSFLPMLNIYSNIIFKIILSIGMVYLAFAPRNVKQLFNMLMLFYLTSVALGGCAFALLYFIKPQEIFMKNGLLIGTYPIKIALLGGTIGFVLIITTFKVVKNKISRKDMFCEIEITFNSNSTKIRAMIDTGNMLREPITKMPVIVVQSDSLAQILPKKILNNLQKIMGGDLKENDDIVIEDELISKLRVIPFSSLGKQHGLLLGFKPDNVKIEYDGNIKVLDNIIIGIYEKELSKDKLYKALIGLDIMGEEEIKNESYRSFKI